MECVDVGDSNPDIAGLGIILSFVIQAGFSFVLSIWSAIVDGSLMEVFRIYFPSLKSRDNAPGAHFSQEGRNVLSIPHQLQKLYIEKMSETISDVQTLNGISLLIGAMAQHRSLNLYHFHIIYDIVNLTGISVCAALINVIGNKNAHNSDRSVMVVFFLCLYLAFVIMFGLRLQTWDDKIPGQCYYANGISMPNSLHPLGDQLYLAITCLYFFTSMAACGMVALIAFLKLQHFPVPEYLIPILSTMSIFQGTAGPSIFDLVSGAISDVFNSSHAEELSLKEWLTSIMQRLRDSGKPLLASALSSDKLKLAVLMLAMLQYPLHIYMIFALRAGNEHLLNGDSENYWGFGQIVALVLLASSVLQGFRAILDYRRTLKKKWLSTLPTRRASI